MWEIYSSILATLASATLGINIKDIKKTLDKQRLKSSGNLEISNSIDTVSKKLEDSKEIIENALLEIEKQKALFEEMKREAEISQEIASMNGEQVTALSNLLEKVIDKQDKKAFPKTFFWNLFFCILSAILGFLLGKYL